MLSWHNDYGRQGLKLSWMNRAGFKYLVGHRFYPNHKRFKIHINFFHETKSVCLHCIRLSFTKILAAFKIWKGEWWWNRTGRFMKSNWPKFRYHFPVENEHLVWSGFRNLERVLDNFWPRNQSFVLSHSLREEEVVNNYYSKTRLQNLIKQLMLLV